MARILFLAWFLQPKQTDSGCHRVHLTVSPRFLWSRCVLPLRRPWLFSSRSGSKNPPGKKKKAFFLVFAFSSPAIKFSTSLLVKVRNLPLSFVSSLPWKISRLKFGNSSGMSNSVSSNPATLIQKELKRPLSHSRHWGLRAHEEKNLWWLADLTVTMTTSISSHVKDKIDTFTEVGEKIIF